MLASVESFGGFVGPWGQKRRMKEMRLKQESDEKTVLVQIKTKQRDGNSKVAEIDEKTGKPTGKQVNNPRYGKFYYESVPGGSLELEQTTPAEVIEAVKRGIQAATTRK